MSNWELQFRYSQALYGFKINLCMGVARYMYGICEQTKCFPGMKKKLMLNLILSLISRLAEALYSTVSQNKNMSFWPACLGSQIKKFWCETSSVFSKLTRTNLCG